MRYDTKNKDWKIERIEELHAFANRYKLEKGVPFKIMNNTTLKWDVGTKEVTPNFHDNRSTVYTVRLHGTDIYKAENERNRNWGNDKLIITLNSGGYRTPTTKDRLNRFLPLGYRVVQRNFNWILQVLETLDGESQWNNQELFYDGMQIEIE